MLMGRVGVSSSIPEEQVLVCYQPPDTYLEGGNLLLWQGPFLKLLVEGDLSRDYISIC